ncbi:unnamed protein product [Toxocara canis]|uniref:Pepsin inhibitor-3-like repeated domain-containing protein n=1 Tax=Toxocara canis TaxID=6265 RepID=A0A3P7H5T7_TOXCA|nr:unnamed protein product [Toxocara canis]
MIAAETIQISSNNGNTCDVVDGVLSINGVSKGPLTPEQQQQLKEYQQKVEEWNKALQQSIQSSFPWNPSNPESKNFPWNPNGNGAPQASNIGNNWPYGSQNNPFGSGFPSNNAFIRARRSAMPLFPSPPPFCSQ